MKFLLLFFTLALSIVTNGKTKHFEYDGRTGNLYERLNRSDRKYGAGGRLVKTENWEYKYDDSGNLIRKKDQHGATWRYEWNGAGMLSKVKRPDAVEVTFKYDALGRRIEKSVNDRILTKWVWDGNVPLHEWREIHHPDYEEDRGYFTDITKQPMTTWLFEEGTFVPAAKLTKTEKLSIVTNYMGTPEAMYREDGEAVWTCELNSYGKVRNFQGGSKTDCPFRYQGQYEDAETGLYYNRFRYYSPEEGVYISQDPIGLNGGIGLYSYVHDTNGWVDAWGLAKANGGNAKAHGGTGHNSAIDQRIIQLKNDPNVDVTSIRKNQQQVDINGDKVGGNRPDIQYDRADPTGNKIHHNEEFDTTNLGSTGHQQTIPSNDPNAKNTFWYIDEQGNLRQNENGDGSYSLCM